MAVTRLSGLDWEVTRRVGRGAPYLSDSLFVAPSGEQVVLPMCWRRTSLSTISRVFVPIFFSGQSVVVDVVRVGFRPRAVVVAREVVSGCTRISSQ